MWRKLVAMMVALAVPAGASAGPLKEAAEELLASWRWRRLKIQVVVEAASGLASRSSVLALRLPRSVE